MRRRNISRYRNRRTQKIGAQQGVFLIKDISVICNPIIRNFYIHIPFCRQKCPYCKFALTPVFDAAKKRRYIAYLKKEIKKYFQHQSNTLPQWGDWTIYFGGWTPSVLSFHEVKEILDCFPKGEKREVSFECNPEDLTREYIIWLLNLWINRISLWIQSLNDATLKAVHRSSKETIIEAMDFIWTALKISKTENVSINVDFILWLPYSKPWEIQNDVKFLHKKYPFITHTSVYMLEEWLYPKEWKNQSIDEKEMEKEYDEISQYFQSLDWHHYEISNWARSGYECRHNQWYWNHTNYRWFGLSATSFIDGVRWENSANFNGYYLRKLSYKEPLTKDQLKLENIIQGLRTFSLSREWFNEEKLEQLENDGFIKIRENKIVLTQAWIFRENFILTELIH